MTHYQVKILSPFAASWQFKMKALHQSSHRAIENTKGGTYMTNRQIWQEKVIICMVIKNVRVTIRYM